MKISTVIGLASTLFRSRKFKILAVGAQLAYLSYTYIKNRNQKEGKDKQISKR